MLGDVMEKHELINEYTNLNNTVNDIWRSL